MRFTWSADKRTINFRRHGIGFEEAIQVFDDPNHVVSDNYLVDGEQRLQIIGLTRHLLLLLVVFIEREDEQEVQIRIISARKAESFEEEIYNEQNS